MFERFGGNHKLADILTNRISRRRATVVQYMRNVWALSYSFSRSNFVHSDRPLFTLDKLGSYSENLDRPSFPKSAVLSFFVQVARFSTFFSGLERSIMRLESLCLRTAFVLVQWVFPASAFKILPRKNNQSSCGVIDEQFIPRVAHIKPVRIYVIS